MIIVYWQILLLITYCSFSVFHQRYLKIWKSQKFKSRFFPPSHLIMIFNLEWIKIFNESQTSLISERIDLMNDIEDEKSGSPCKIANKLGTAHDRESQHVTLVSATLSSESFPYNRACMVYTSITHEDIYVYDARNEIRERMRDTRIAELKEHLLDVCSALYVYNILSFNKFTIIKSSTINRASQVLSKNLNKNWRKGISR